MLSERKEFYRGMATALMTCLLVCLAIYVAERTVQRTDYDLVLHEKMLQQNTLQKALLTKYEMQIAFYEYILALDVEGSKEKARDARIAWDEMMGNHKGED